MYKLDMTILIVISSNDGRRQLPAAAPQPRVAWARARYVVQVRAIVDLRTKRTRPARPAEATKAMTVQSRVLALGAGAPLGAGSLANLPSG